MPAGTCSTCRNDTSELLKGECRACYQFRYRNGTARPEEVAVQHARRFNAKQAEREMVQRYVYQYGDVR